MVLDPMGQGPSARDFRLRSELFSHLALRSLAAPRDLASRIAFQGEVPLFPVRFRDSALVEYYGSGYESRPGEFPILEEVAGSWTGQHPVYLLIIGGSPLELPSRSAAGYPHEGPRFPHCVDPRGPGSHSSIPAGKAGGPAAGRLSLRRFDVRVSLPGSDHHSTRITWKLWLGPTSTTSSPTFQPMDATYRPGSTMGALPGASTGSPTPPSSSTGRASLVRIRRGRIGAEVPRHSAESSGAVQLHLPDLLSGSVSDNEDQSLFLFRHRR